MWRVRCRRTKYRDSYAFANVSLIMVGVTLIAEGFDVHVPRGYIYFAMTFSVVVEMLNIKMRKRRAAPVALHKRLSQ